MLKSKIVLGSANFSKGYGIKKSKGITLSELNKIARELKKNYIETIDTALSYPNAEKKIALSNLKNFKIYTKISKKDIKKKTISKLINIFKKSLTKLKKKFFNGIYIHNSNDLKGKSGKLFYSNLEQLKKKNLTKKIGISVYSPRELEILFKRYNFDIVQIPLNIFDRRFLKKNFLKRLKAKGIEIHIRSIFLQGVLLQENKKLPKFFKKWVQLFKKWEDWNSENNQHKLKTCIDFVKDIKYVDKIVVGASSSAQIKDIIYYFSKKNKNYPNQIFSNSKKLIDPRLWTK